MHPGLTWSLCRQRQRELVAEADRRRVHRQARRPGLRRWNVSWTRLSPGDVPGAAGQPRVPGAAGQPRSSWMIIISAGRPG